MKKKKDIKKNKNQKKSLNKGRNNKNILHLFFLCFSIFILGLLLMEKYIYNEGFIEKILYNILQIFKLIFAKGLFTFLILSIVINFIEIYKKKSRRNNFFRKVFFCLAFLSFLALLSLKDLGSVSSINIFDAGQDLLSLAFEKKGGGLIGYITLIPFYSFLKSPHIYTSFFVSTCIFTLFVIFKYIRLVYLMIYRTYSYYNSDDYEKKKKILQAKKEYDKNILLKEEKEKEEEFTNFFINMKEKKLDSELYKDENGNKYDDVEFEKKKKQWNDYQEKMREFRMSQTLKKEKEIKNEEENIKDEKFEEVFNEEEVIIKEEIKENDIEENVMQEDFSIFEEKKEKEEAKFEEEKISEDILFDKIKEREDLNKSIEELFIYKNASEEKKEEMKKEINDNIQKLEGVLKNFGIDAKVVEYAAGPTITRYEIRIPFTVKVKRVTELEDNLKMHLKAESIRMEAPIPGKDAIGIETPNKIKEVVHFSNMIRSEKLNEGILPIILGKDIIGKDKIIDITKLPHLLIAGTTGSGKSIAINTMIASLISKKSEDEVRFIMIDPKMVELMPYNGIPHLLTPVIIDPNMAQVALKWAVNEMEERYKKLASLGLKNIESYNKKYSLKMPYIVIVIDELADLMMVASNSVEYSITRIAQKARAIGIHLIVATQRPSVDVVTGMIKANLPSRISFALRSSTDSRTILDQVGAEKLLGKGDMLFLDNGKAKLERIQGAFVTDDEIIKLTDILKSKKKVVYNEEILVDKDLNDESKDPLFDKAVEISKKQEDRLSISLIQRELRVGYNRAARICDELKNEGIIDQDNRYINLDY